jgi:uncharacterized protein YndB with AHSA1/START domain
VRVFDAPPDALWRAWTDPQEWPHWMHPTGITTPADTVSADVRVGGRYRFTMIDGNGNHYPTGGIYRELVEPERLVFTCANPNDPQELAPVITVTFNDLGDGRTEQTFHVLGVDGQPGDDSLYDGWSEVLDGLARIVS